MERPNLLKPALVGLCSISLLLLSVAINGDDWIVFKVGKNKITSFGLWRKCTEISMIFIHHRKLKNCTFYSIDNNIFGKEWSLACNIIKLTISATVLSVVTSLLAATINGFNGYITSFLAVAATIFTLLIICLLFVKKEMKTFTNQHQNEGIFGWSFFVCVVAVLLKGITSIVASYV